MQTTATTPYRYDEKAVGYGWSIFDAGYAENLVSVACRLTLIASPDH
jgi:hypothetical protein